MSFFKYPPFGEFTLDPWSVSTLNLYMMCIIVFVLLYQLFQKINDMLRDYTHTHVRVRVRVRVHVCGPHH